jgi:hypothetical protein
MFRSTKQSNVSTTSSTTSNSGITTYNYPYTGQNSKVYVTGGGGSGGSGFTGSGGSGFTAVPISNVFTLPMSGIGSSNSVLTSAGWTTNYSPNTVSITGTIVIDSNDPIIKTKKHKINLDELYENIQILNEMFSVIVPNKKKMSENPTLKDAYEEYNNAKLIEPKYNSEEYRTAYEQYKLLETLVKEEHDNS